jgi:23S rRNA (cytidine2498-2'-O)-methyltransferase
MSLSRVHVCAPRGERLLVAELGRALPGSRHAPRSRGFVESALSGEDAARTPCVAFALQCLPSPEPVCAASISMWAAKCAHGIMERLAGHAGPWRLHVFCCEEEGSDARARRCALVEAAVLDVLKAKQRRLLRTRVAKDALLWADGEAVVQIALESSRAGLLSIAFAEERTRLRRTLSRFSGGIVEIADDPAPPSRAYRKLLEAELRLGAPIGEGETCADLGAAPGGWTHVALGRGAHVTAVDRSPLRADLMAHPRLDFVKGDAFAYAPPYPVDWLLSDVIAYPVRVIDLIDRWISARLCRRFVTTVKFKGEADYPEIERLKAILERSGAEFEVRRLCNNKNEVTAFGSLG